jgi:hypothetical protein
MTTSFCKADEEFINPNNFDLVISGLFELKIYIGRRRIRTRVSLITDCNFVLNHRLPLGHAPLCNHLLEMNVSKSIYKDITKFS